MRRKGYTLVEVLSAIVILGIIVTMMMPTFLNMMSSSTTQLDNTKQLLTSQTEIEKSIPAALKGQSFSKQKDKVKLDVTPREEGYMNSDARAPKIRAITYIMPWKANLDHGGTIFMSLHLENLTPQAGAEINSSEFDVEFDAYYTDNAGNSGAPDSVNVQADDTQCNMTENTGQHYKFHCKLDLSSVGGSGHKAVNMRAIVTKGAFVRDFYWVYDVQGGIEAWMKITRSAGGHGQYLANVAGSFYFLTVEYEKSEHTPTPVLLTAYTDTPSHALNFKYELIKEEDLPVTDPNKWKEHKKLTFKVTLLQDVGSGTHWHVDLVGTTAHKDYYVAHKWVGRFKFIRCCGKEVNCITQDTYFYHDRKRGTEGMDLYVCSAVDNTCADTWCSHRQYGSKDYNSFKLDNSATSWILNHLGDPIYIKIYMWDWWGKAYGYFDAESVSADNFKICDCPRWINGPNFSYVFAGKDTQAWATYTLPSQDIVITATNCDDDIPKNTYYLPVRINLPTKPGYYKHFMLTASGPIDFIIQKDDGNTITITSTQPLTQYIQNFYLYSPDNKIKVIFSSSGTNSWVAGKRIIGYKHDNDIAFDGYKAYAVITNKVPYYKKENGMVVKQIILHNAKLSVIYRYFYYTFDNEHWHRTLSFWDLNTGKLAEKCPNPKVTSLGVGVGDHSNTSYWGEEDDFYVKGRKLRNWIFFLSDPNDNSSEPAIVSRYSYYYVYNPSLKRWVQRYVEFNGYWSYMDDYYLIPWKSNKLKTDMYIATKPDYYKATNFNFYLHIRWYFEVPGLFKEDDEQ